MLINPHTIPQVSNAMMNMLHEDEAELVNKFHDAVCAREIEKIDSLFEELLFDAEDHFATEEAMMEQNNYDFAQVHKADHDTMREKLKKTYEEWKATKDPSKVKTFLEKEFKQWFSLHISKWDADTAPYLG